MSFETAVLGAVGMIPLVLGIVEAAKKLGIEGKQSFVLALGVGFVFGAYLEALAQGFIPPVAQSIISVIVVGVGGGLAASGIYDLGTGKNQ